MAVFNFLFTIAGVVLGYFLFRRLRYLKINAAMEANPARISVIIPARNEAHNLEGLLTSLASQTLAPYEVICVDDASEDRTNEVATQHGAMVIRIDKKPAGWLGKSYACHRGAQAATGDLLLFLDADVRLMPDAVRMLAIRQQKHTVVSVQPKHIMKKWYEQFCLFFNLIVASPLGARLPFTNNPPGLFGPVICIPRTLYWNIGGHEAIKHCLVDDISLGESLGKRGIRAYCCLGDHLIRFRMYPDGVKSMQQGWTKNFATGATKSPFLFLVFVAIWISALIRTPIELCASIINENIGLLCGYSLLYIVCAVTLYIAARTIGNFRVLTIVLYPVPLVFFVVIFLLSLYKKVCAKPIYWKGRDVTAND